MRALLLMLTARSRAAKLGFGCSFLLASTLALAAQDAALNLDEIYKDESHCLVAPEIRGPKDRPISCYCRDALVDASYVYQSYLQKDRNLAGAYLTLELRALEKCGDGYDVSQAVMEPWRWNGPEVIRKYPPNSEIDRIKPDGKGLRSVVYEVFLTYRDQQGHVANVEIFKASEVLRPDYKKQGCPPSAICPK